MTSGGNIVRGLADRQLLARHDARRRRRHGEHDHRQLAGLHGRRDQQRRLDRHPGQHRRPRQRDRDAGPRRPQRHRQLPGGDRCVRPGHGRHDLPEQPVLHRARRCARDLQRGDRPQLRAQARAHRRLRAQREERVRAHQLPGDRAVARLQPGRPAGDRLLAALPDQRPPGDRQLGRLPDGRHLRRRSTGRASTSRAPTTPRGSTSTTASTTTSSQGNYVASVYDGIILRSPQASGNVFRENVIGIAPNGGGAAPLTGWGFKIGWSADHNLVEDNIIANAARGGIGMVNTTNTGPAPGARLQHQAQPQPRVRHDRARDRPVRHRRTGSQRRRRRGRRREHPAQHPARHVGLDLVRVRHRPGGRHRRGLPGRPRRGRLRPAAGLPRLRRGRRQRHLDPGDLAGRHRRRGRDPDHARLEHLGVLAQLRLHGLPEHGPGRGRRCLRHAPGHDPQRGRTGCARERHGRRPRSPDGGPRHGREPRLADAQRGRQLRLHADQRLQRSRQLHLPRQRRDRRLERRDGVD